MISTRIRSLGLIAVLVALSCATMVFARRQSAPPKPVSDGMLSMSGTLSRSKVHRGGDGEFVLTLDLVAPTIQGRDIPRRAVDLVLVLDRSGSMEGYKIDYAKKAVQELIETLGAEDRFGMVTYSDSAVTNLRLTPVTESNRHLMREAVAGVRDGGGTNLEEGLRMGMELLTHSRGADRSGKVVLISDGLANQGITDPSDLGELASRATLEEFTVSAIGVGEDFNEFLMTHLADRGRGRYTYLDDPVRFAEVFMEEYFQSRNVVVSDLELSIELPEGVRLLHGSGYPIEHQGSRAVIRPGDMVSGQHRKIYLTLEMDTETERTISLRNVALAFRQSNSFRRISLNESFDVACVADSSEAFASIDREQWEKTVVEEEYNRLKEDVARDIAAGEELSAREKIDSYRKKQEIMNQSVGSDKVAENLEQGLSDLNHAVDGAFSGTPAEAAAEQKRTAKSLQFDGYSGRRSNQEVR